MMARFLSHRKEAWDTAVGRVNPITWHLYVNFFFFLEHLLLHLQLHSDASYISFGERKYIRDHAYEAL